MNTTGFKAMRVLLVALLLSSLSACSMFGGGEPIDPKNNKLALVFGYLDMDEAASGVDWVSVKRYKPEPNDVYTAGVQDGLFWHVGIEMGSYQVEQFGANPGWFSNVRYIYNFGTSGRNETAVRIDKPGVYFLGAYKYKHHDSGSWLKPDKFSMEPLKSPSEKELLQKLLKIMKDDSDLKIYTHQISWIEKRLAQLR